MSLILKISIRNFFRQKRRNFLLGSGIAFGMCVLILANAFSHGISDILLNKIIVRVASHITVNMAKKDTTEREIIRDVETVKRQIHYNVEGVKAITENVLTYGKGLGNGKV
jgi:ABC-type lipoprotein release transport system permease subunit